MKRLLVLAAAAAVVGLGCVACDNGSAPSPDGDLSSIQSTLDSIQSEMAGDGQR
ncbi:hypothetical protein F9C11_22480 [Amycolatopsis sp. VS8301801F10]|uniref:hypothetical protein n=1 Tax=unclassified Amycolatopsis TaxID=2618356 RepID=UPI0038FC7080